MTAVVRPAGLDRVLNRMAELGSTMGTGSASGPSFDDMMLAAERTTTGPVYRAGETLPATSTASMVDGLLSTASAYPRLGSAELSGLGGLSGLNGSAGTASPIPAVADTFDPSVPIDPAWAAALPEAGVPWSGAIGDAAARNGVDPRLLSALVWTESGFRPDAVSEAGARGLAQLMPRTAEGLGVNPDDPLQNLDGGARYLRSALDRFGSLDLALAAYNAGPRRVAEAGGIPDIPQTRAYVSAVLDRYRLLGGPT